VLGPLSETAVPSPYFWSLGLPSPPMPGSATGDVVYDIVFSCGDVLNIYRWY